MVLSPPIFPLEKLWRLDIPILYKDGCLLYINSGSINFFPSGHLRVIYRESTSKKFLFSTKNYIHFFFSFSTHQMMQLIPPQLVDSHILLLVHILKVVVAIHLLVGHILRNLDFLMQDMEEVISKAEENVLKANSEATKTLCESSLTLSFSLVTFRQVKPIFKKRGKTVFILFGH